MARYCVHLDATEVEVSGVDVIDEIDAIRVARDQTGISEVKHQRAHRLPDLEPVDVPAPAAIPVPETDDGDDDSDADDKPRRGRRPRHLS